MENRKKGVKAGEKMVLDPEVIYARALALQTINPEFDLEKLLVYELAPYPMSIFNEEGLMRTCKKSKLMAGLKVEVPARMVGKPDAIFLDGCAILWVVGWPTQGNIGSFVKSFRNYLRSQAACSCSSLASTGSWMVSDFFLGL